MEEGDQDANEDGTLSDASSVLAYQDSIHTDNDGGGRFISKVFEAPLGIVYVQNSNADFWYTDGEGGPELALEVMPGNYKGVKSSPIFRHNLAGSTAKSM